MSYLSTLVRLIFPERCLGCKKIGGYLCVNCLDRIPPAEPITDLSALACFDYYDKKIKKAIWLLKYKNISSLAPLFAKLLYDKLIEQLADEVNILPGLGSTWLVIPIPLSHERQRERGYNQAALITRELVKLAPQNLTLAENILIKIKHTPTQVSISNRRSRLANLKNAFALAPNYNRPSGSITESIKGRRIILVDDVITTGATIREAMRLLKHAGAKSVIGIAVAHG